MELGWDLPREGMEGIKDKRIQGRGGTKAVRYGGVDEIDKEGVWEKSDCIVISVMGRYVVRTAGKSIRGAKVLPRDMLEVKVKLREVK